MTTCGSTRARPKRSSRTGRPAEAVELRGRGELLADLDDDWVLEARELHRRRLADLLGTLGDAAEAAGDAAAAVRYAREQRDMSRSPRRSRAR